jgi:hypothetical protein
MDSRFAVGMYSIVGDIVGAPAGALKLCSKVEGSDKFGGGRKGKVCVLRGHNDGSVDSTCPNH